MHSNAFKKKILRLITTLEVCCVGGSLGSSCFIVRSATQEQMKLHDEIDSYKAIDFKDVPTNCEALHVSIARQLEEYSGEQRNAFRIYRGKN